MTLGAAAAYRRPASGTWASTRPSCGCGRENGQVASAERRDPLSVQLLHVPDCPTPDVAAVRLRLALVATGHPDVASDVILVRTDEQARELDFRGSPTVILNHRDPFARPENSVGPACRLYRNDSGTSGAPSREKFVEAILNAVES